MNTKEKLDILEDYCVFDHHGREYSNYTKFEGWIFDKKEGPWRVFNQLDDLLNDYHYINRDLPLQLTDRYIDENLKSHDEVIVVFNDDKKNYVDMLVRNKHVGKSTGEIKAGLLSGGITIKPLKETWLTKFKNWIW